MSPIVVTRRRTLPLLLDGAVTCAAWVVLAGLCLSEWQAIQPLAPAQAASNPLAVLEPVLQTLLAYLLAGSFDALLMTLWLRYRQSRARPRRAGAAPCDAARLAARFHVSGSQVCAVQGSRMAIIHHADGGGISGIVLEPDPLEAAPAAAAVHAGPRGIRPPAVLGHPADIRPFRLTHEADKA